MRARPSTPLLFSVFMMTVFIWGTSWIVIKYSLDQGVTPLWGTTIRFFVASIFMIVVSYKRIQKVKITKNLMKLMLVHGLFMIAVSNILVFWGQQFIASNLASILFAIFPLMVAGFSHILLKNEKLNQGKLFGIFIGLIGVVIIFFDPAKMGDNNSILRGMLAIISSIFFIAIPTIIIKRDGRNQDPFVLNTGGMIIGFFALLIIAIIGEGRQLPHYNSSAIIALTYLGIFASSINFVAYFWLMKYIEVTKLSLSAYLTPIITVIVASLLYNESVGLQDILGMIIIFSGIFISDYKSYLKVIKK
ncbi:MAG: EamA family transporter [Candidatus Marinimicrobia bacterium]|nr:EamA family transporter [Candidatus Neomarinimicrobiota bacterium]